MEKGSEAAMIIEESKCGKYVEPHDYDGIRELITWFIDNKAESKNMGGLRGREYLEERFKMETSLNRYKEMLYTLATD